TDARTTNAESDIDRPARLQALTIEQRNLQRSAEVDDRRLARVSSEPQEPAVVGKNRLLDDAPAGAAPLQAGYLHLDRDHVAARLRVLAHVRLHRFIAVGEVGQLHHADG